MKGAMSLARVARRLSWPSLAVMLIAAGCAMPAHQEQTNAFDAEAATKVFAAGYAVIQDRYIEPINSRRIATAGLAGLSTIDAGVTTKIHDRTIHMSLPDGATAAIPAPADDDSRQWAVATSGAIAIARDHSKALRERNSEELYQAVFKSSLSSFDRFSRYLGPTSARNERARRDGYGGIGVLLQFDQGRVLIEDVMPESPAARGGMKSGDILLRIDSAEVSAMERSEIADRLRGRINSKVSLTLQSSADAKPTTLALRRAHIVSPTVSLEPRGNAALIRISGFNQGTAASLSKALEHAYEDMGPELKGFVLDMRDNPGGLLDQAIAVTDRFLTSGRIVSTKGRHANSLQSYDASQRDESRKLPVVVLVNGRSASAAEIVAAALQDDGRAVVVGSNTYGKGTVQNLAPLPNNGELVLTWSYYHAPSGYALHNLGVLPNVCTSGLKGQADGVIEQLSPAWAGLPLLMAAWRVSLPNDGPKLESMRKACPRSNDLRDLDIDVAIRLIGDPALYRRALQTTGSSVVAGPLQ